MEQLAERLRNDGYDIVDTEVIPMACNIDLVRKPEYKGDVLVVMACDAGVYTIQNLFPSKKIVSANVTVGVGARDGHGNIFLMKRF